MEENKDTPRKREEGRNERSLEKGGTKRRGIREGNEGEEENREINEEYVKRRIGGKSEGRTSNMNEKEIKYKIRRQGK